MARISSPQMRPSLFLSKPYTTVAQNKQAIFALIQALNQSGTKQAGRPCSYPSQIYTTVAQNKQAAFT
eukprot:scaffold104907_cov18-Tisochrysis_lutea.AAC.2